jgi:RNA recognition motif-containing protein
VTQNCTIYVKGFDTTITEERLKEFFTECGAIKSMKIPTAPITTGAGDNQIENKPYGYITFENQSQAKDVRFHFSRDLNFQAVDKFNQQSLDGKQITVNILERKEQRRERILKIKNNMRRQFKYSQALSFGQFPFDESMHMHMAMNPMMMQRNTNHSLQTFDRNAPNAWLQTTQNVIQSPNGWSQTKSNSSHLCKLE